MQRDPDIVMTGTSIEKRSVVIAGHRTSVSLEPAFWAALKEIAARRGVSLNRLIEGIDTARPTAGSNLSSTLRVFVLRDLQARQHSG
jgi:predicted DNA-binding ribbon-helix-helix protein